jgi:hypothetical protein
VESLPRLHVSFPCSRPRQAVAAAEEAAADAQAAQSGYPTRALPTSDNQAVAEAGPEAALAPRPHPAALPVVDVRAGAEVAAERVRALLHSRLPKKEERPRHLLADAAA